MRARVMATTGPSQSLTDATKGSLPAHLPWEEIGSSTARNSSTQFLRHCLMTKDWSKASMSCTCATQPQRNAFASAGVKVSPLPVPNDLKNPTLTDRRRTKRSSAIAITAKGTAVGLIRQK